MIYKERNTERGEMLYSLKAANSQVSFSNLELPGKFSRLVQVVAISAERTQGTWSC